MQQAREELMMIYNNEMNHVMEKYAREGLIAEPGNVALYFTEHTN